MMENKSQMPRGFRTYSKLLEWVGTYRMMRKASSRPDGTDLDLRALEAGNLRLPSSDLEHRLAENQTMQDRDVLHED